MAKTLVIKGVNFSENKIETVTLINDVPCTGISLAEQTANVAYGGTYTPVPTVTPNDTTDPIIWTSSNEYFSVNNGVVSINGVGQAVITATCGSFSASVTLTSTESLDISDYDIAQDMYLSTHDNNGSQYVALNNHTGSYTIGRINETGYHVLWNDAVTRAVGETFCPAIIPSGSTHLTIVNSTGIISKVDFADTSKESTFGYGAVEIVSSDMNFVDSVNRTLDVPSDADGYYISFRGSGNIEIVFS